MHSYRGFRATKGCLHFGRSEKIAIKDLLLHCAHTDTCTLVRQFFWWYSSVEHLHQWALLLVGSWCSKDHFYTKTSFWPKCRYSPLSLWPLIICMLGRNEMSQESILYWYDIQKSLLLSICIFLLILVLFYLSNYLFIMQSAARQKIQELMTLFLRMTVHSSEVVSW